MTFSEFTIIQDCIANKEAVIAQINALSRPEKVCGVEVPSDLSKIEIWQLLALKHITEENAYTLPAHVLLNVNEREIANEKAEIVLGFTNFVAEQLQAIWKKWEECSVPPTAEERKAGVEKLDFGDFGLIDWYARRMGITKHEEAEHTPWVIVWQCKRNDAIVTQYERRLQKVYEQKHRKRWGK